LGEQADAGPDSADESISSTASAQISRRRGLHLDARLHANLGFVGWTLEDERRINETRGAVRRHLHDLVAQVMQSMFSEAATISGGRMPQTAAKRFVRAWLTAVVTGVPDRLTGEPFTSLAHDQVRPAGESPIRIKGGALVIATGVVQAAIIGLLADLIDDAELRAETTAAWCKLLLVQLDIVLKVHGATESSPRWY
jgi:hypothetical protein